MKNNQSLISNAEGEILTLGQRMMPEYCFPGDRDYPQSQAGISRSVSVNDDLFYSSKYKKYSFY